MKILISERLSEHKYKTPEGYLVCVNSILARTGKQTYHRNEIFHDNDDTEVEVDRTPEEVFSSATLASFENKPITVEHPDEDVNVSNYKDYSVGFVRDVHRGIAEGQDVMLATLVFTDEKAIQDVEDGIYPDLSCGYDCDIEDEENPTQRNIRGNHVAICQQGRAGIARIVDSVNDMALSRTDAMDRCIALGKKFIEHFDKLYKNPESESKHHWSIEMKGFYDKVKSIKLKTTNNGLLDGELRDWFFTAGANPQDFMINPTNEELSVYDKFVSNLLRSNNVQGELRNVKLIDKLIESGSNEAFKKNIAEEIRSGKSKEQAAAIAYSIQRANDSEEFNDAETYIINSSNDKAISIAHSLGFATKQQGNELILLGGNYRMYEEFKKQVKGLKGIEFNDSLKEDIKEELKFAGINCNVSKYSSNKYLIECESKEDADRAIKEIENVDGIVKRINNRDIELIVDSMTQKENDMIKDANEVEISHDNFREEPIYVYQSDADKNLFFYIGKTYSMKEGEFTYNKYKNKISPEALARNLEQNGWHKVSRGPAPFIDSIQDAKHEWTPVVFYADDFKTKGGYDYWVSEWNKGKNLSKAQLKSWASNLLEYISDFKERYIKNEIKDILLGIKVNDSVKDATRHEVVVYAEEILNEMGKNNSIGKYDRVVQGAASILGEGFLHGEELKNATRREVLRLLKKYNLEDSTGKIINIIQTLNKEGK